MLKQLAVVLVLTWITVASSWSLFHPSFFHVHDYVHGARVAEMSRALADGHIPPRWSENFGYGYGMPLFQFYAPLPYYVGAAFFLLGVPLILSVKALFLIASIGTAIGSYKLSARLFGRAAGLVAAAAITLAPYRAVNLFVRGALSETWAIMALIWVVYFCVDYLYGNKKACFGVVTSLVALFLSHNIMTLLSAPYVAVLVIGLFLATLMKTQYFTIKTSLLSASLLKITGLISAAVLAVGISAYYVFPAYLEKDFTKIEQYITGGYFDYQLHFLYLRQFVTPFWGYGGSGWGPDDGLSFFLGFGQLFGVLLAAIIFVRLFISKNSVSAGKKIFLGGVWFTLIASLFLATEKSKTIWDSVELLKFVQFPWRTLSLSIVSIGILISSSLLWHRLFIKRWLLAALLLLILLPNAWYFRPSAWLDRPEALYYSDESQIREEMSSVLPDYIPADLAEELPVAEEMVSCRSCEAKVLVNRTHEKLVSIDAASASSIEFAVAAYPGWFAEIDGQRKELSVSEDGLLQLEVPAGSMKVGLIFGSTQVRFWTDWVSIGSLLVFVALYVYSTYDKRELNNAR